MNMKEHTVIEGVYTLREKIAEGGMAVVFTADVNLNRFDYTKLYAYTQVQAEIHTERVKKAEAFAGALAEKPLDVPTVRAHLESHGIPMPGSEVAVKVSEGDIAQERFEAEWRNLICLNHDNVIEVYGGGTYMQRLYYSMELIRGIIPPKKIRKEFPFRDRISVIIGGANGLAYLHRQGIVHRDVKPDNIVTYRDADGSVRAKVTDLGLAKSIDQSMDLTATGQIMGTPYYMAPEQIESSRDADCRADIYSLGASLYDLLIGVPPYHNKTSMYEIIASVSRGETPIDPQKHLPRLPDALSSIIRCAMARDPGHRYQNMSDMAEDLETYVLQESPDVLKTIISEGNKQDIGLKSRALKGKGEYIFERIAALSGKPSETSPVSEGLPEPARIIGNGAEDPAQDICGTVPEHAPAPETAAPAEKKKSRKILWIAVTIILIIIAADAAYVLYKHANKEKQDAKNATEPPGGETGLDKGRTPQENLKIRNSRGGIR